MPPPAKECTELMIPLRVIRVPNRDRPKAMMISTTFQTFSMPRLSWIITE